MKSRFNGGLRHGAAACVLVLLAACGGGGGTPTPPAPAIPDPVVRPSASASQLYAGEYAQFTAGDVQAGVSWRWEFSDGTTADGLTVERRFAQAGSFTATAIAQNSAGVTVRASTTVQVEAVPAPVARASGPTLLPGCSGLHCAVAADGRYAGSGVGIWRLRNDGATSQLVDADIGNVQAGQAVTLVFSNGETKDAAEVPKGGGTLSLGLDALPSARIQSAQLSAAAADQARQDAEHAHMLAQMQQQWLDDLQDQQRRPQPTQSAEEPRRRALATTDVGSTRIWNDLHDDPAKPVPFTASVLSTCSTGTGRRLVFWVDQALTMARTVEAAQLEPLRRSFCGDQGGYARVIALLGDVWGGSEVARRPWLIQETAAQPQDVNIVVTNHMGAAGDVAGYFHGINNSYRTRSSRYVNSNEALAFFVNGSGLASNPSFYTSTLVHELTHMVNYHQRSIQRNVAHDVWLEEVSAMAIEDLLAETITPGANKIVSSRLPTYLRSGGGLAMIDWLDGLESSNYGAGGSLAAFLNRRYGSTWVKQLVTDCGSFGTSYSCVDMLTRRAGGAGLADEWERLGSSLFGGMPLRHAPLGYGFPQVQWEGFWLMGTDTAQQANARKLAPVNAMTRFGRTSHSYQDDTVPTGATRYVRRGVRVPAGTVLTVVVR
jgi:PKD repeat protein